MTAKEFVKSALPGSYVFSPCIGRFVVKVRGEEIADRAKSIGGAWSKARKKLKLAAKPIDLTKRWDLQY